MSYRASISDSLSGFSDAELDRVTASSNIFLDRRWFRLLDSVELPLLVRGELNLRYVVVSGDDGLAALCPFIVTRSPSIFYQYSLEKFFFKAWRAELARINPNSSSWSPWAAQVVDTYRRLARLLRTGIEGWVLAVSPLSFRSGITCRTLPGEERHRVHELVLAALEEVAREECLPLCVYGLQEDDPLRNTLRERDFDEVFLLYDNRIEVDFDTFERYLQMLPGKTRRKARSEIRKVEELGYRFELRSSFAATGAQLEAFYDATYSKYGEEYILHPRSFWVELERSLGANAEALIATQGGSPAGFSMLLHKGEEMWVYRMGRASSPDGQEPPIYFSMIFYEPLKRALELGVKRVWFSGGAWEVKRRRGARGVPLYSYFRFPSIRSRLVLAPFLSAFARISHAQMSAVTARVG